MSMLDSFFKQRFNAAKCKTLLKLTIPRIKLLRNRRELQLKQMRREIAKLLETRQEATARIRVEHIIREEKMMAAQEIVELFCELIAVRLPIIEAQRECPLDLKEAISSVCFAAPRCADLPELLQVQILFAGKYGREFIAAATELMPECGVNRQVVELLSIRAPAPDVKLKLLKEIAEEHGLDWDSSASEKELLKPHEDLLNGPTQFVSGSKLPLPEEKQQHVQEAKHSTSEPSARELSDSDREEEDDGLDFPEVPKQQPVNSYKSTITTPEMLPFPASALSEVDDQEEEPEISFENHYNPPPSEIFQKKPVSDEISTALMEEDKQFSVFISPQTQGSPKENDSPNPSSNAKIDNVDLQDVLAAAKAAAESAERAAAAARSAASIAQLRISELVKKQNDEVSRPYVEKPFNSGKSELGSEQKVDMNSQGNSLRGSFESGLTSLGQDNARDGTDSTLHSPETSNHQPQKLPSMDNETFFSYPNLFKSQDSSLSSRSDSFTDSK